MDRVLLSQHTNLASLHLVLAYYFYINNVKVLTAEVPWRRSMKLKFFNRNPMQQVTVDADLLVH
jgi:hypothetical protein